MAKVRQLPTKAEYTYPYYCKVGQVGLVTCAGAQQLPTHRTVAAMVVAH
jgi:hypothetical protein